MTSTNKFELEHERFQTPRFFSNNIAKSRIFPCLITEESNITVSICFKMNTIIQSSIVGMMSGQYILSIYMFWFSALHLFKIYIQLRQLFVWSF